MADVVFIVGAGCSAHAGAPVMSNFLDCARDLLAAREVDESRTAFETTFKVISYLQRVHSKSRLDHNNIEAVFSAVDLARTIRKLPGIPDKEIDDALKALVTTIVRTLEKSIKFPTRGGRIQGTQEYGALAKLIAELADRDPRLTTAVLSFNYDIAIDLSFASSGIAFSYGLIAEQGVPLLKLHGSLNWGRTKNDRVIVPYGLRNFLQNYRMHFWTEGDDNPSIATSITEAMVSQLGKQGHEVEKEPVLVPPTWSKGEYHRDIAEVWTRAARELAEARFIFVIGYSLPETDQFFRLLFALGTEGAAVLSKIAIFDPYPEPVERRFREMLGNAALDRFSVYEANFGQAVNIIDQILFQTGKRRPTH